MNKREKKVGIMGGTFDPIHVGHLILGETAYEQFGLDKVFFMPAGNPPHKKDRQGRATDEQRVEMVKRAIASNPHFELSLVEMNEDGYSYTYRTLEHLKEEFPDTTFYFILGADSLFDFASWKEPQRICDSCVVVVATRNHTSHEKLASTMAQLTQQYHGQFETLDSLNIDVSSQMLRTWVMETRTIKYYVTDTVIEYIEQCSIYKDNDEDEL